MPDRLRPPSNPDTIVGRSQLQLSLAELLSAMSLVEFTNFMNNAAALEKFLKLLQGFAQLGMSVFASAQLVETSTLLRKHFALGRRYFRVFKWIDCALVASAALCGDANGGKEGVLAMLNVAKWSYLGMFLFTEALTLLDAMDLKKFEWAPMIFTEAMRFWFYSISCGLILIGYDFYLNRSDIIRLEKECELVKSLPDGSPKSMTNGKPNGEYKLKDQDQKQETEKPKSDSVSKKTKLSASRQQLEQAKARRGFLLRQLVANACDLLTPGSIVKYTPMPPAIVAITSIVSSSISSQDLWRSINST
ncbi:peroxisomal biogenesis factor 11 [Phyllosticta capitalensis]|uniref:Peroxisomal biogenesis factor 11 n=2 Tax=Phyllosticta capitalensis TaxID=121624 RepID=A0ABR1Z4P1_9PEZI